MRDGRPGAPASHPSKRGGRRGPARRSGPGFRGPGGASPGAGRPGRGPWASCGRCSAAVGARTRCGGRRPGGGADRSAEGGGGWGGVTGLSRWKCLESLLSAQRGLERSLRGYLSFCLRRNLPGPSPVTVSLCLRPQQSKRFELLLKAPDAPGPSNSRLAWGLRHSFPGSGDAFPALRLRWGTDLCVVGSPWEAGLEPTAEGKGSVTGRRDFRGKEK